MICNFVIADAVLGHFDAAAAVPALPSVGADDVPLLRASVAGPALFVHGITLQTLA